MVANPVVVTLNTVDTTAYMKFPSAISGTIYFADTIFDVPSGGNVGVIRSYNPANDDLISGTIIDWVRAMSPVFDGTQLAAVFNGALWIYDPVGDTWTECGQPYDIFSKSIPSLNSNNIFVYGHQVV